MGKAKNKVVILAFYGTEARMQALWEKNFSGARFKIVPVREGYSLFRVLSDLVADAEVEDKFILVRANMFPSKKMSINDLKIPVVYVDANGREHYDSRMPSLLDKAVIAEMFSEMKDESDFDPEKFLKKATASAGFRYAVGHSFGNYVTQVLRPAPCIHKIIEAFLRKAFIATNLVGWNSIIKVIDETLTK